MGFLMRDVLAAATARATDRVKGGFARAPILFGQRASPQPVAAPATQSHFRQVDTPGQMDGLAQPGAASLLIIVSLVIVLAGLPLFGAGHKEQLAAPHAVTVLLAPPQLDNPMPELSDAESASAAREAATLRMRNSVLHRTRSVGL